MRGVTYRPHPAALGVARPAPPPLVPRLPGPAPQPGAPPRGRPRWLLTAAAILLIPIAGAAVMLGTRLVAPPAPVGVAAVFAAPITVLRAPFAGRIAGIAVSNGQTVAVDTTVATVDPSPPPNPAQAALRARLADAVARAAALDARLAVPAPSTEAGRAKVADGQRLRAATGAEVAQLRAALATASPPTAPAAVKAGLNGKVWSVEATAGADTAAGAPLVRLVDCDHGFLSLGPAGTVPLAAGQAVEIRMAGLPPATGRLRLAAGATEPVGALVAEPAAGALSACPVGMAARVFPRRDTD